MSDTTVHVQLYMAGICGGSLLPVVTFLYFPLFHIDY